jgi:hypothetical protein
MLFTTFVLFACSGPLRWVWVRGKRLRLQMRRRAHPAQTPPPIPDLPPADRPSEARTRSLTSVGTSFRYVNK